MINLTNVDPTLSPHLIEYFIIFFLILKWAVELSKSMKTEKQQILLIRT